MVVYTSEDKIFSEPVLQEFEKKTGIKSSGFMIRKKPRARRGQSSDCAEKDNP